MKVRISIPGRVITVDMENERKAVRMFNQMAAVLLELQERQEGGRVNRGRRNLLQKSW